MVYGIAKMLNFAHGDVIMVGGFAIFTVMSTLGLNPLLAVLISIIICTILGMSIERIAYKPLRKAPSLAVLITAIGVSYLLQNIALIIFGADPKSFTSVISVPDLVIAGGKLTITGETLVTIPVCIIIMIGLTIFVKKSKTGRSMLAVSEDKDAAVLMGVNVNKTIAITFAIGSGLAAAAGVLVGVYYNSIDPLMGIMPGIKAFVAAVLGGIGIIPGAMLGGLILGVVEALVSGFISSTFRDAAAFAILIIILLFRPSGLLGKNVREKV
jgi:branched-chain amino acid transport system permease protein